jgi:hypothetical protein
MPSMATESVIATNRRDVPGAEIASFREMDLPALSCIAIWARTWNTQCSRSAIHSHRRRGCMSDWNLDGLVPTNLRKTRAKWLGF